MARCTGSWKRPASARWRADMAEAAEGAEVQEQEGAETVEDRARRMGWVPKEEFKGNPSRWSDASTWVERTENEMPVLRGTLGRLEKQNRDLRGKLDETSRTVGELRDFYARSETRSYERAKRELQTQFNEKVGAADIAGAEAVRREIEELPKPPKAAEKPAETKQQIDPAVPAWVNATEQAWYRDDANMQAEAQALHSALLSTEPGLTIGQNLAKVRQKMAALYPEKLTNARRDSPAAVLEPHGGGPKRTNGRTFDDLPADAKAAYERFARTIKGYKKEEYLANYV